MREHSNIEQTLASSAPASVQWNRFGDVQRNDMAGVANAGVAVGGGYGWRLPGCCENCCDDSWTSGYSMGPLYLMGCGDRMDSCCLISLIRRVGPSHRARLRSPALSWRSPTCVVSPASPHATEAFATRRGPRATVSAHWTLQGLTASVRWHSTTTQCPPLLLHVRAVLNDSLEPLERLSCATWAPLGRRRSAAGTPPAATIPLARCAAASCSME